ncbi:MAG TPA: hypothetical protein VFF74_04430 [Methylophilaceae bacterium]|nr:hypothetical protein [Methylophilaceae bacterium]
MSNIGNKIDQDSSKLPIHPLLNDDIWEDIAGEELEEESLSAREVADQLKLYRFGKDD